MPGSIRDLDRAERLQLMQFVCSFAWADLEVRPEERDFVARMVERLELDASERQCVRKWLEVPPAPEAIDPTRIPLSHRRIFVESIEGVIVSDGVVQPEERENFDLLKKLLY